MQRFVSVFFSLFCLKQTLTSNIPKLKLYTFYHRFLHIQYNLCSAAGNQNTDYTVLVQIGISLNFAPCQVFQASRYNQIP